MNLTVAYTALAIGVLVWFALARKFTAKSWEANTPISAADAHEEGAERQPAARVGLYIFMGVMTSLFGLFISAYYMRMGMGHGADAAVNDWRAVQESPMLWINSAILLFGSVAMQKARASIGRGAATQTQRSLLIGGVLTAAFVIGQLLAWRELRLSDAFAMSNPAVGFFYLLTGVHAIHLLGGLYVWGRTYNRLRTKQAELIDLRLSVELCTVYWHYLLLVWIVLFGLLLAT